MEEVASSSSGVAAAQGPAPSRSLEDTITLPNMKALRSLNCVEMPCYVNSIETGIAMMGGNNAYNRYIQEQTPRIPLFLSQPGSERDPLRAPIIGQMGPCQGVVVKLVRRVVKDASGRVLSSRLVSAQPVGKVERSYQFTTPADFQFCAAPDGRPLRCPNSGREVIETVPRPFSRKDPNDLTVPLFADTEVRVRNREQLSNQRAISVLLKMNDDVVIPSEPTHEILQAVRKRRRGPERKQSEEPVTQLLKVLFEDRAMWSYQGLAGLPSLTNLNSAKSYIYQQLLPLTSYRVAAPGAWHGSYARYGYDPRKDPASRWLQGIGFKVKAAFLRELEQKVMSCVDLKEVAAIHLESGLTEVKMTHPPAPSSSGADTEKTNESEEGAARNVKNIKLAPVVFLKSAPQTENLKRKRPPKPKLMFCGFAVKRVNRVQICDIMDELFIQEVSKIKRVEQPTEKFGWFTESTIELLRSLIISCFKRRASAFLRQLDFKESVVEEGLTASDESVVFQTELSYLQSSRHLWYQKYMRLPDLVATEEEMLAETSKFESGAGNASSASKRPLKESIVRPIKRRKGISATSFSTAVDSAKRSTDVQNVFSVGGGAEKMGLGLHDVEAFEIFDMEDSDEDQYESEGNDDDQYDDDDEEQEEQEEEEQEEEEQEEEEQEEEGSIRGGDDGSVDSSSDNSDISVEGNYSSEDSAADSGESDGSVDEVDYIGQRQADNSEVALSRESGPDQAPLSANKGETMLGGIQVYKL